MRDAAQQTLAQLSARTFRPQPFDLDIVHTPSLVDASAGLVKQSKALCETARDLRQNNADLREFLHESLLRINARRELWRD
jgi:hypothetical protein